ncbi:MAG: aminopeptidase P family N-terminal domain-containing protein, partial [Brachybacterium tyrofermentans]
MTFAPEEYERRLSELRRRMGERELDAVIITDPENLMYLTDYQTTGYSFFQALIVPLETDSVMITRALEESNVIARTWLEHSRAYPDSGDAILELVSTLRDLRLGDAQVGYERNSYYFPAYQQDRFHDAFGEGLVDCFG